MKLKIPIQLFIPLALLLSSSIGWAQSASIGKSDFAYYEMKSAKEMMAYQDKVVSKVTDFYNYLEIISNPKVETRVREHTVRLTKKMFLSDVEVINFLSDTNETVQLGELLTNLLQAHKKIQFSVSNTRVSLLKYDQNISYTLVVKKDGKMVNYQLNQLSFVHTTSKNFGHKTKDVVITSLGEISK